MKHKWIFISEHNVHVNQEADVPPSENLITGEPSRIFMNHREYSYPIMTALHTIHY